MDFPKYKLQGDYHWREYEGETSDEPMYGYKLNVLKLVDLIKEKKVLEIGCGDGVIASKLGAKGIDTDEEGIRLAKLHGVDAEVGTAYELEKYGKFEAVLLADTLEHLEFPERALKEISKITKILYILVPKQDEVEEFGYTCWNPIKLTRFMEENGWKEIYQEVQHRYKEEDKIFAKYENISNNW